MDYVHRCVIPTNVALVSSTLEQFMLCGHRYRQDRRDSQRLCFHQVNLRADRYTPKEIFVVMGLMSGLTGNAAKLDTSQATAEFGRLLGQGEQIQAAYMLVRDAFVFTNRRLILIDKQGMTGKKVEYTSIPYRHIHRFSVETAGHFDLDAELKIWVAGHVEPIKKEFRKGVDIYEVQAILALHTTS